VTAGMTPVAYVLKVELLGHIQGIIYLNSEILNDAFQLRMSK
jgi:hypothetical protein